MQKQKGLPASATPKALQAGISTLIGIIIIVAVAVILFGGVFAYQYYLNFKEKNQKISLCEQEYQKNAKSHLPYTNTNDYVDRVKCLAKVAVDANDLSICDKVDAKNSDYTLDCYIRFAVEKNDLSVCEKLKGVLDFDQRCNKSVKNDIGYLDKNNIYINPVKWGDVKITTPKAGDILDKNKQYKITWTTDTFSENDTLYLLIGEYWTGNKTYLTLDRIPAKQGYYNFTPNSLHEKLDNSDIGGAFLENRKKYYIYLDASGDPNNHDSKLHGMSDLFEFN